MAPSQLHPTTEQWDMLSGPPAPDESTPIVKKNGEWFFRRWFCWTRRYDMFAFVILVH
jgi:hypothetical protein